MAPISRRGLCRRINHARPRAIIRHSVPGHTFPLTGSGERREIETRARNASRWCMVMIGQRSGLVSPGRVTQMTGAPWSSAGEPSGFRGGVGARSIQIATPSPGAVPGTHHRHPEASGSSSGPKTSRSRAMMASGSGGSGEWEAVEGIGSAPRSGRTRRDRRASAESVRVRSRSPRPKLPA